MRSMLSKAEMGLLTGCTGLLALAILGPEFGQPVHQHAFADQRTLWGVPFALNVLSNIPFALVGLWGIWALSTMSAYTASTTQRAMAALFFTGLLFTAAGSTWYHWCPNDAGLAIDRCGMAVTFAGLLGVAAAGRVSERAGTWLGLSALLLGPVAVRFWAVTGNVLPWAVVQFGGIALVLVLAGMQPRSGALGIRWSLILLAYATAKLLEANDHAIYQLCGQWVSGHTLKHMVAALAAWPVIAAVWRLRNPGQNAAGLESTNRSRIPDRSRITSR